MRIGQTSGVGVRDLSVRVHPMKLTSSFRDGAALAAIFWYLIGPGGYVPATTGQEYMCEGMIWSVPDPAAKKVWTNSLGSLGPFQNKSSCEDASRRNPDLWGKALCLPEDDPRVDPDTRAYDHFPIDPKTGDHVMPPEYRTRHPERVSRGGIDINRPCPPEVHPPASLVEAQQRAERLRPELERRWRLYRQQQHANGDSAN
jgi:hypothetical protein